MPRVQYAMDDRPKNSLSMSYAWRKVNFPGVWLVEGSRSVEALASRRLEVCGSFDADIDVANLLV